MKKMRLHIYILLGFFLTTFIIGSFLDLQISQAIFSEKNTFGLVVSIIGTLIGYSSLAFCGGGLFGLGLTRSYKTIIKVFIFIGAAAAFASGLYFAGREFFGPNGFEDKSREWLGYLISLPFMCAAAYLGYYVSKKSDNELLLFIFIVLLIAIFMSLVPGVTLIKAIFHRPRYRTLSDPLFPEITFHHWWERCTNYKDLMNMYDVTSEEFKSFPSGHAAATLLTTMMAAFIPMFDKKAEKKHYFFFYGGILLTALVAFARMLVGAHFLSDVSMGALLTSIFILIANEAIIIGRNKFEHRNDPVEEDIKPSEAE